MKQRISALLCLVCFLAACSGAGGGGGDTLGDVQGDVFAGDGVGLDADAGSGNGIEQPAVLGRVAVYSNGWGGVYSGDATITMDFYSAPVRIDVFVAVPPDLYRVAARGGDCVLYERVEATCTPACKNEQFCSADGVCQTAPQRQSVGKVTLTSGAHVITAEPGDFGYYPGDTLEAKDITPEATFSAQAEGGDLPTFSIETTGVEPTDFGFDKESNSLTLVDGKDNKLTWTPVTTGGTVQLVINSGWHGSPPDATLFCEAPASAGSITIPRAAVEAFPSTGGPSLMQHASYAQLVRNARAQIAGGEVELLVGHRHGINPMHNAEW